MEYEIEQLESIDDKTIRAFYQRTQNGNIPKPSHAYQFYLMEEDEYTKDFGKHMNDTAFAAIYNEKIIRLAWARADFGHERNLNEMGIKTPEIRIAVEAEYQGRGIGTSLMKNLLYSLAEKDYYEAVADVEKNDPSLIFFLKLGFNIVKDEFSYYHISYQGRLMMTTDSILFDAFNKLPQILPYQNVLRISTVFICTEYDRINGIEDRGYPYVIVHKTPRHDILFMGREFVKDGWTYTYDQYMCWYEISKELDIRTILNSVWIRICFIKRTDERDLRTFRFTNEYQTGTYKYDIPDELKEDIALCIYRHCNGSHFIVYDKDLEHKIIQCCAKNIIDDEYNALVEYEESLKKGEFNPVDGLVTWWNGGDGRSKYLTRRYRKDRR
ncbi:MAG: GNAT family N-acetyltransferase [Oscillospiraceae bacterium]|nr:GNAT family N-acetyltransferase [Oscillospiraceae bacterium]